jgi:hypothetical protein
VFEKWVLRKIFGTKRDKITGDYKKLHYEELHKLTFLNEDEMGGIHGTLQTEEKSYRDRAKRDYLEELGIPWRIVIK